MRGAPLTFVMYTWLGAFAAPLLTFWLRRRAQRGKEDPFRLGERFGQASRARPKGTLVWLHAASVGEARSVLTLVKKLLASRPETTLLITTGTVTSAALVAQQSHPRVIHQFLPIDTLSAVRQFLQHWRPDLALWVESELWPQLLVRTHAQGIPLVLVNARLSERSFATWKYVPRSIAFLLRRFAAIYASTAEDANRLRSLGAADVREAGNLKYDADPLPTDPALLTELRRFCSGRRVWVAASTHANEENYIAHAHQFAAQQFPTLLTVIVPRHPPRGAVIAQELRALGLSVAQRSKGEAILPETAIYLADTMGELGNFYALAELVFMGGSLVAHGGQNPLEAARFGVPILTGPFTHNFAAIVRHFEHEGAIRIVPTPHALVQEVAQLFNDIAARRSLASRAAETVAALRGASDTILQQCMVLLERQRS